MVAILRHGAQAGRRADCLPRSQACPPHRGDSGAFNEEEYMDGEIDMETELID